MNRIAKKPDFASKVSKVRVLNSGLHVRRRQAKPHAAFGYDPAVPLEGFVTDVDNTIEYKTMPEVEKTNDGRMILKKAGLIHKDRLCLVQRRSARPWCAGLRRLNKTLGCQLMSPGGRG
jgi:hypothetical protein